MSGSHEYVDGAIQLTMPWPPIELHPNSRPHWAVKSKKTKQYRETCAWQAIEQGATQWPHDGPISFHLVFYPPNRRLRDDDGLIAAFKAGRDGIADALKVDDHRFKTTFEVAPSIGGMVKVFIKEGQ